MAVKIQGIYRSKYLEKLTQGGNFSMEPFQKRNSKKFLYLLFHC